MEITFTQQQMKVKIVSKFTRYYHTEAIKYSEPSYTLTIELYNELKNLYSLLEGLCPFLSALQSHWRADMLQEITTQL